MSKRNFFNITESTPQGVKKFYFLDYFLILLQSCNISDDPQKIFTVFKTLKEKERLGESKYKKLIIDDSEELSDSQVARYKYTFKQVISESLSCGLLNEKEHLLSLTKKGRNTLNIGLRDKRAFYDVILKILEKKYSAFYHLIKLCYEQNSSKNGLLIFPIYSPRKLGFDKKEMKTNNHLIKYSNKLRVTLEKDIEKFLSVKMSLKEPEKELIKKLIDDDILVSGDLDNLFNSLKYNAIIGRFRKFWLNYFLNEIYEYPFSFTTFNIWVERGKQLGVIHTTEFYPNFDGRLVYPTSIIVEDNKNNDLVKAYDYGQGEFLFIHKPKWKNNKNKFIDTLHNSYFDLKNNKRTNFIRISDLREKVCYKLKLPTFIFNNFLQETYNESLKGETKIQISLEADRLPQETSAMYLKREPVIINNQQKNIIAIDYKK
ncbi:hypothetical protein [Winogradskyella psychrotolerans]|uniref:hypothetical protein n=1 Tax=Winogradskyella psychrotolerans TaxID=1344585 RepID=UPI001C06C059|nr:hypothetical protein [Winogradskyella psychrotolerans]MBU2929277.1 hypothetical protein [Winogradskyella psychrotolerans]